MSYDEETAAGADKFNLGTYFEQYGPQIIKGVLPTRQFMNDSSMKYAQSLLLVVFVADFNDIFDSQNIIDLAKVAKLPNSDLRRTLLYKVLAFSSNLVKVNKKTKKQVAWIEETRSINLEANEKQDLV